MSEDVTINIRDIQHYMYCPRRFALLEVNDDWAENAFVVKANLLHENVHSGERNFENKRKIVRSDVAVYNDDPKYNIFHGQVVVSTHAIKPVTATLSGSSYDAPPMFDYLKKHVENLTLIDADTICREIGSQKVLNMVLLGAAIRTGVLDFSLEEIEEVMKKTLPEKFHEMNLKALRYA